MNNHSKSEFVADNTALVIDRQTKQFRKTNKKAMMEISREDDYNKQIKFMGEAVMEMINSVKAWEEKEYAELDGLTAIQYYENLDDPEDIIDLISMVMEKTNDIISPSMEDMIKKNDGKLAESILKHLESVAAGGNSTLCPGWGKVNLYTTHRCDNQMGCFYVKL